jgi:hypothetical protein
LIGIRLLRRPLFFQARQLIIRTAERNGIPWRKRRSELMAAAAPFLVQSRSEDLVPPAYYQARFHAYEQGNLCWQAAAEAEQATDAMALRIWLFGLRRSLHRCRLRRDSVMRSMRWWNLF